MLAVSRIRRCIERRMPAGKSRRFFCGYWLGLVITLLAASTATSAPTIVDLAIVEVAGRPGHQGFSPIQGQPIVGSKAFVRARLAGAASSVTLNLRDRNGNLFGQVPMVSPPSASWPPGIYFAEFIVPTVPFAMSVSGTESGGTTFEATFPAAGSVSPQTLAVRVIPTITELPRGFPVFVTVQATNYGPSNTFSLSLTNDAAATVVPPTFSLALGVNESAGAQFQVTIPASPANVFTATLTATAASSRPAGSTNTATLELPIAIQTTQPPQLLSAWVRPNEKRDLIHLDKDGLINVWVCDTGVNGNTITIANLVRPTAIQQVAVAPRDKDACGAASAFELTFIASRLITALNSSGLAAQKNREIQVPLTAYSTNGTPLIGYVPLLF